MTLSRRKEQSALQSSECLNNNVLSYHSKMDIDVILVTSGLYSQSAKSEHFYSEVCCPCFLQPHKMQTYVNYDWKLFSVSDCFLGFFSLTSFFSFISLCKHFMFTLHEETEGLTPTVSFGKLFTPKCLCHHIWAMMFVWR